MILADICAALVEHIALDKEVEDWLNELDATVSVQACHMRTYTHTAEQNGLESLPSTC